MKHVEFRWHSYHFTFPADKEPFWKDKVHRWSQLDAYAFGLVAAYENWQDLAPKPSLIILASPSASNETDFDFVKSGGLSPSKFAHTLPNIRGSPLCQIMNWSGPVLCVQRDPETLVMGLKEGFELWGETTPTIWILGVIKEPARYSVHCLELLEMGGEFRLQKSSPQEISSQSGVEDTNLLQWLGDTNMISQSLSLGAYEIHRKEKA